MERATGTDDLAADPSTYSVGGLQPSVVVRPGDVQALCRVMAAAWEDRIAVAPWGGGTRIELGNAIARLDAVVDLSRLGRVIQHNPADLTVTVEAGISLAGLQRELAEHGQFVAMDPPLPDRASVGGTLATGVSGPLKWQYGHSRDLVLGMKVVQADGTTVKSGGRVVKNVSGYDMAKLHIGGLGTLGIIAEVSFRLFPIPPNEATLLAAFETSAQCIEAGESVFRSDVIPLALTSFDSVVGERAGLALPTGGHFLAARLGGRPLTVERQVRECQALCERSGSAQVERLDGTPAGTLWRRLSDFGWDDATVPTIACRVSLPPAMGRELEAALQRADVGGLPGPAIVFHHGFGTAVLHWFADDDAEPDAVARDALERATSAVRRIGGRMVVERCPPDVKSGLDVWGDIGGTLAIMRRMKEQYDPRAILNPGRFAGRI